MKALRKTTQEPGELTLCDIPEPVAGPGEVLIQVHASGLCGTDMHIREGGYGFRPPVTLGHEIGGEVIDVGESVTHISVGDRVTVNPTGNGSCGRCRFCHQGSYFFCPERRSVGSGIDGGFAQSLVVPGPLVFGLPDVPGQVFVFMWSNSRRWSCFSAGADRAGAVTPTSLRGTSPLP